MYLVAQTHTTLQTEDMQQEAIDLGMSSDSPRRLIATNSLAIEAMDKYHIEKVCAIPVPCQSINDGFENNTDDSQDIAQYIKKEVRQHRPSTSPGPLLITRLVRFPKGRYLALCCWTELWKLRYAWSDSNAPPWLNFWLTISAETKHFIYFYLGHCAILLFKTQ